MKMEGVYLSPLSLLNKDLQVQYSAKYANRENIPLQQIPYLNTTWSDVLHLSPVDLSIIKQYIFQNFGINLKFEYYKIPLNILDQNSLVIYLNHNTIHNTSESKTLNDYIPISNLEAYQEIPKTTKEHYKSCYENNMKPLLFFGVPHVFFKGQIPIEGLEALR
jgi:hypothetical protein